MAKLTVKKLESLRVEDAGSKIRDEGGLVGVIRSKDENGVSVKFDWRYRFEGKVRSIHCGTWPKTPLAEIRAKRDHHRQLLADGKNPADEGRTERLRTRADQLEAIAQQQARIDQIAAQQARMTANDLFERWERLGLCNRKDKGAEVRRSFQKDVLPRIGDMAAEDVTRPIIAQILDGVVERGAPIVARNLLGDIRQMFGFALVRGLVEHDPTSHMKRDDFGRKVERDRVLSENEIKEMMVKLPTANLLRTTELAIWIMLSTCCRVGELSQARWADVDLECSEWRMPSENTKNGKEHRIYLSGFALHQFKKLRTFNGLSEWCYPAEHRIGHVCLKSITKQIRDRQRSTAMSNRTQATGTLLLSGGGWTPHDLRRTGATLMGRLGVRPDVIEKCLNHIERNPLIRVYQHQRLEVEQAEAWRLLGERLELLTRSDVDNVVIANFRKIA